MWMHFGWIHRQRVLWSVIPISNLTCDLNVDVYRQPEEIRIFSSCLKRLMQPNSVVQKMSYPNLCMSTLKPLNVWWTKDVLNRFSLIPLQLQTTILRRKGRTVLAPRLFKTNQTIISIKFLSQILGRAGDLVGTVNLWSNFPWNVDLIDRHTGSSLKTTVELWKLLSWRNHQLCHVKPFTSALLSPRFKSPSALWCAPCETIWKIDWR